MNPPPPPESPLVGALFAELGLRPGEVATELDPQDEMVAFLAQLHSGDRDQALFSYFRSGWSIADAMLQVLRWRFGADFGARRVLDFASGYGRVTRFLVQALRPDQVWVADIYAAAVHHQRQWLGVQGLESAPAPEAFDAPHPFDAILVTSLFTHLPAASFHAWLRRLGGLVAPGGVLAFSVHDESVRPPGAEMPPAGLLFEEQSESDSLAASEYGSTWVTEAFVRAAAAAAAPGAALHRIPRGVCNFQDLYLLAPPPAADFSTLRFRGEPQLFVERCQVSAPDVLELSGWAARRGSGGVRAIEARLDGALLTSWPIERDRPDVAALLGDERHRRAGWQGALRLPAAASRSAAVLVLRIVDDEGRGFPAVAGTIDWHLLEGARRQVDSQSVELARARAELADLARRHAAEMAARAAEAAALGDRIRAMEASRFWKLRNRWFALKRRLRLTDEP